MSKHSKKYSDPALDHIVEIVAHFSEDLDFTVADLKITPIRGLRWQLTFEYVMPVNEQDGNFIGDIMAQLRALTHSKKFPLQLVYLHSIWSSGRSVLDENYNERPVVKVSIHCEIER